MALINVNNLNIFFGEEKLVNNISFSLNEGEVLAIVGQSGSGKSVTAMSIAGLIKSFPGFSYEGEIIFKEKDLAKANDLELRKLRGSEISYIFQDPMTSLNPLHRIGKQLREAIYLHQAINEKSMLEKIYHCLDLVGLSNLKDRLDAFPYELSGGQRQRVMIAMALINDSSLIIADEPTTALDVTVQKGILELFADLKRKLNQSLIFISHDLTVVKKIADKVAVMYKGEIVEVGDKDQIFNQPQHEYTKKLLDSLPKGEPVKNTKNEKLKGDKNIIEAEKLDIKYIKNKSFFGINNQYFKAAKNINFSVKQGQTLGIVGESGSGKSSIAKALLKLIESEGRIVFSGDNISSLKEKDFKKYRSDIQIVFQDPYSSLNPRMTVYDLIAEGYKEHFKDFENSELTKKIDNILESLGLKKDMKNRYPNELSGGEKQRISIARALILEPKLIILDEPTSALDLITQSEILKILKNLQLEKDISFIFISHDLRVIKSISHNILVMKDGEIIESGINQEIFENAKNDYTKTLIEDAFY